MIVRRQIRKHKFSFLCSRDMEISSPGMKENIYKLRREDQPSGRRGSTYTSDCRTVTAYSRGATRREALCPTFQ